MTIGTRPFSPPSLWRCFAQWLLRSLGNGNGHSGSGHGPPGAGRRRQRWCEDHGKPASQGKGQEKKAEKAAQRDARKAAREAEGETPADGPKHDNPAWPASSSVIRWAATRSPSATARTSRRQTRSACASRRKRTTATASRRGAGAEEPADDETTVPTDAGGEDPAGDDPSGEDAPAVLRAFFAALTGLVF